VTTEHKRPISGLWRITSTDGVELGTYSGSTPADALDAMARDAGYENEAACEEVCGKFQGHVAYVGRSEPPPVDIADTDEMPAIREEDVQP